MGVVAGLIVLLIAIVLVLILVKWLVYLAQQFFSDPFNLGLSIVIGLAGLYLLAHYIISRRRRAADDRRRTEHLFALLTIYQGFIEEHGDTFMSAAMKHLPQYRWLSEGMPPAAGRHEARSVTETDLTNHLKSASSRVDIQAINFYLELTLGKQRANELVSRAHTDLSRTFGSFNAFLEGKKTYDNERGLVRESDRVPELYIEAVTQASDADASAVTLAQHQVYPEERICWSDKLHCHVLASKGRDEVPVPPIRSRTLEFLRNITVPLTVSWKHRTEHMYAIGSTGTGKTTLLRHLIQQDIEAGRGVAIFAVDRELLDHQVVPFLSPHRLDDVIYFNPEDERYVISLNPVYRHPDEPLSRKARGSLTVLERLIGEGEMTGAARLKTILRFSVLTLLEMQDTTLLDLRALLSHTDESFRKRALEEIKNPGSRNFWLDVYPRYPRDAALSLFNRLEPIIDDYDIQRILCSTRPPLDFAHALNNNKILLFNLSPSALGDFADLIGQAIFSDLLAATFSRDAIPPDERQPFAIYVDEFQEFVQGDVTAYKKHIARARKYNVALHLTHQNTAQIREDLLRQAISVGTCVAFRVRDADARRAARFLGMYHGEPIDARMVQALPDLSAFATVGTGSFRIDIPIIYDKGDPSYLRRVSDSTCAAYRDGAREHPAEPTPEQTVDRSLDDFDPGEEF